jgi:hypothetical protein
VRERERATVVLPLGEEELLGGVVEGEGVEHAVVGYETLEEVLRVAVDPVDHEAAVRRT